MAKKKKGSLPPRAIESLPPARVTAPESEPIDEAPAEADLPAEPTADEIAKDAARSTSAAPPSQPPLAGAAWARPLVRIERGWTWVESRLLVVVLLSLIVSMVTWVSLRGMALPLESESRAGTAFRILFGMAVAGGVAQLVTRKMEERLRNLITGIAIVVGGLVAPLWRAKGVDYSEHLLNWLQEGSSLTMFGGLRGVSTRLTILLALTGASLAAASGKHINIDVVLRFLPHRLRKIVYVISSVATLTVCISAAWGFFDYISIESFGASKDASAGEKISHVGKEVSRDGFLWRKQTGLDFSALFHVVGGGKWDDEGRMNGRQWNTFLEEGGFRDHFTKAEVDDLLAPPEALDESRIPMVVVPGGSPRGLLIHSLDLLWCIGLINIGLRFMMRMLLVMSGHASADPEPEEFDGVVPPPEVVEEEAEHALHPETADAPAASAKEKA